MHPFKSVPRTIVDTAKTRLLNQKGDPLAMVDWRALFFNFIIDPSIVRSAVPLCFELDLHSGKACVSLVALTKQNIRRHPNGPWSGNLFRLFREQRFLNLRVYVRYHGEPGIFFLWGWLSRPWQLPLPDQFLGLTCAFADINYSHPRKGTIKGLVQAKHGTFVYSGRVEGDDFLPCSPGSLAEFAMERYSGFFWYRGAGRVFRAWHEPWRSIEVESKIEDLSLITNRFPWFARAQLVEARLCADCLDVWLGRPHQLESSRPTSHHRARVFFEMP